jgi:hypothetical protein
MSEKVPEEQEFRVVEQEPETDITGGVTGGIITGGVYVPPASEVGPETVRGWGYV